MSKIITLNILNIPEASSSSEPWMIVPRPVIDWRSRCVSVELNNVEQVREIEALNALQHAYLIKPLPEQVPHIRFKFIDNDYAPDYWIWELQDNRYTRASSELGKLASELAENCSTEREIIHALITNAAEYFGYAHPDIRFNQGHDDVPMLCGTTKGSCVDINTYLIAAARSLGIKVQYMAGYWFHPERTETLDMHCWLAFECDSETVFWDLAHHLKWGVEELAPGLNPAGGRRVPMTCGRGLQFDTPYGEITISHFSEPLWVLPSEQCLKPDIRIGIAE
ncbi:MAG: transglutaminase-like domain-containing protein [Candidatus Sedimenticola sp. PURPLELP]